MITHQQFEDAVADFEGLIGDDWEAKVAVLEAATSNEIDPAVFEARLTREATLNERADAIRRKLELDRLNHAIRVEVESAASKRHPKNALDDCFDLDEVAARVERRIGRPITENEVAMIADAYRKFVRASIKKLCEKYKIPC